MANKYLVETAIDVGIENLKKLRNTDPKALYEEVKKEISTESSAEIKKLYQNYIDLYEKSLAATNTKTGALGEEIKWKNLGDLKKAVEAKGVGLSSSDREGLNQFALAEYAGRSTPGETAPDADTITLLHAWFRIYESLKAAPVSTAPVSTTTDTKTNTPVSPSSTAEALKYDLKVYEGYALQELTKSVRIIRDLKAALVMKGGIKLEINNVFDQATLDAIFAYQRSAKLNKVDGLVGSETIGSLFGIALGNPAIGPQDIPYPVTPTRRSPIGSQGVPYPAPGVLPQGVMEPPATIEPARNISKEFTTAYNDLMSVAKGADKWFWEQDDKTVTANKQKMGNAYANFQKALSTLNISTLNPADRADAEKKIRDVALYFSNSLNGVSNSHFRNYQLSAGLLISLLDKDSGGKEISGWPTPPTETEILSKLKGTPSGKLMVTQMDAGAKFEDIIANPKIKGAWETVTKEVYGKYTAELEAFVKKLDTNQSGGNLILTIPQQESLKALKALIGAGTGWDYFSAQSKDSIVGMGKAVPAIIGGGLIAATGIGAGPGAFLLATGAGALATTGGMMIASNRVYSDLTEAGKELGLNVVTLGAGGVIFRLGGKYLSASKGLHYTNMGLLQPLGNVAIGASTDVIRGQLEKTDVRFTDAFWHNAPWALLPFVLAKGWKWTPKQLKNTKETEQAFHDIERKAALGGDTTAAQKKLAQDVAEQSADVKNTVQASSHPTPSSNNTSAVGGKTLDPLPPIAEPHAPATATVAKATTSTATTQTSAMRDLHDWLDGAIPKNAKIGEDIKLGNAIVTPREKGVYELKYKDTHQTFSNKKDLVDGMNTLIKNPSDRIKLLDSSQMKHLDNHLATFHEQVVPNTNPPVRIMRESEGKMALDVQDPHTKGWVRTTPEKLSESDLAEVVSTYTGRTPAQLKEGWFKAKSAKLSDMVSPAEEKHIVDKHGSKFWDKFKGEFAGLGTTSGSFKDALIGMVPVPGIGKSKMAWKSAIAGSTAFEIFEYITSSDPMQKTYDVTTADGIRNVAGALAQVLLYKYMGWIVGTIVPNAPRIWDTATQGTRRIIDANTPATEVPAPATTQN